MGAPATVTGLRRAPISPPVSEFQQAIYGCAVVSDLLHRLSRPGRSAPRSSTGQSTAHSSTGQSAEHSSRDYLFRPAPTRQPAARSSTGHSAPRSSTGQSTAHSSLLRRAMMESAARRATRGARACGTSSTPARRFGAASRANVLFSASIPPTDLRLTQATSLAAVQSPLPTVGNTLLLGSVPELSFPKSPPARMIPPSFGAQMANTVNSANNALEPSHLAQHHVPSTAGTNQKRVASNHQLSGSCPPKRANTQPSTTNQPSTHYSPAETRTNNTPPPHKQSDNGDSDSPRFENQPSNSARKETSNRAKNSRKRLDASIVELMKHLENDQLRQKVNTHAQYKRLTAEDRRVFTKAYNRYQHEVLLMAAERLL
ncbi:hypothetical protein PTTG_26774 [Puccinia triticina 1-1 BBBD Race 1]|uniref:Uncharacterized protein n=1 Tax=Puccinia triticina (isolate 1-1 / race 1 (BBBD)) TaxID=630390 RepID=A0A180GRL0_PUCT1|nr:hypothetical protein PTTG_26774 [Puccinia triticina 1-1 BBBD Race 1]